jgi:hypothetical protein
MDFLFRRDPIAQASTRRQPSVQEIIRLTSRRDRELVDITRRVQAVVASCRRGTQPQLNGNTRLSGAAERSEPSPILNIMPNPA